MRVKGNVRFASPSQAMAVVLTVVERVYRDFNVDPCITSAADGVHKVGSLHARGAALDFRTHDVLRDRLHLLVELIRADLGPAYDVLLEDEGGENEHLHVEYDPKS